MPGQRPGPQGGKIQHQRGGGGRCLTNAFGQLRDGGAGGLAGAGDGHAQFAALRHQRRGFVAGDVCGDYGGGGRGIGGEVGIAEQGRQQGNVIGPGKVECDPAIHRPIQATTTTRRNHARHGKATEAGALAQQLCRRKRRYGGRVGGLREVGKPALRLLGQRDGKRSNRVRPSGARISQASLCWLMPGRDCLSRQG